MSKVQKNIFTKFVVVATLVLFMIAQYPGVLSSAEAAKATVSVKHIPLKHFVAGHRIQVEAKVADSQDVSLVRCYFRAVGQVDYVFVGMKAGEKDTFTGILPSPAAETKGIEYLFLTVNGKNQVVKTQVFKTEQKVATDVPDWQKVSGDGHLALMTELPQATAPKGFNDSITTDVVESSARFGIVAGLYGTSQATGAAATAGGGGSATGGGATGAAAAATSAGTVAASAGLTTTVIVGASAAVVAVVAGAVVATGGGGGDDGGGGSASGCDKYAGNWAGQVIIGADCLGRYPPDSYYLTVRDDCSATFSSSNGGSSNIQVVRGEIMLSGQNECGPVTFKGRFTSSTSFSHRN